MRQTIGWTTEQSELMCASLNQLKTRRNVRVMAKILLVLLLCVILGLFIPWQQTIPGFGRVTAFSPMNRPQTIEAQITARLAKWYVREGDTVQAGQMIAELAEIDPKFQGVDQIRNLANQRAAAEARKKAAGKRLAALEMQLGSLTQSRGAQIPGAKARLDQNANRLDAAQKAVEAASQALITAELNNQRIQELYQQGLRSKRDSELAQLDYVRAKTELQRAQASLSVANQDVNIANFDVTRVTNDTLATVQNISAAMGAAQESLAAAENEIAKTSIDLQNFQQRITQRTVRAPRSGRIVRLLSLGPGETVDQGDILATIVPDTMDQAVELFVSDFDAPLISIGKPVRLQFSGWPAFQFPGFPSTSIGDVWGRVAVVDSLDSGNNQYRILVKPTRETIRGKKEDPWPTPETLRPGTSVTGWVFLNRVPLWFELWRQFNGFRPLLQPIPGHEMPGKVDKTGKVGKASDTTKTNTAKKKSSKE